MLEIWKIEDQSIDRVDRKYIFSANIEPSWHFTVQMAIEIHHFNFEIRKRENFPIFLKKKKVALGGGGCIQGGC